MRVKLLLLGILLASSAAAQRGGRRGGGDGAGMNIPVGGPATKNHMELMSDALHLSKEQKKDLKALMDEAQKEAAPLRDQMAKGRAQIAGAIQRASQEEIDSAIKSYSDLESQMTAIEMKAFAGIYKALQADQKQRLREVFAMMPGIFARKNWVDVEQP
jgi:Spy/CpxP family protein refolding chaperone